MDSHFSFDGFESDIPDEDAARWSALLAKAAFAMIVVGLIIAAVTWVVVSAEFGALMVSGTFAATVGLFVIRQAILGERA